MATTTHATDQSSESMQEKVNQSRAYVESIDGCAFDHGYVCRDEQEDTFASPQSQASMVSGNFLRAWQVAAEDFATLENLTAKQKELKHYKFGFTENDQYYIILYQALQLPTLDEVGKPNGIMRSTMGLTTKYWISKSGFVIDKRLFYKT